MASRSTGSAAYPPTALLGCGEGYGRAVAACLLPALGEALELTNRHSAIAERLATDFPAAGTDNAAAVRRCRWVGILVRPNQVEPLLAEIAPHLSDDHLLLNFTARRWTSRWPKLDLALSPPVAGRLLMAFYRPDPAVAAADAHAVVRLLGEVAEEVLPTADTVAEMTLMARAIVHLCRYAEALVAEGHSRRAVPARFEQIALALRAASAEEIVGRAATEGGITSAVAGLFAEDPSFRAWVARERDAVAPWLDGGPAPAGEPQAS